jgi:hypothetical protein
MRIMGSAADLFFIWYWGGASSSPRQPLMEIPPPCFQEETPRQGIC